MPLLAGWGLGLLDSLYPLRIVPGGEMSVLHSEEIMLLDHQ